MEAGWFLNLSGFASEDGPFSRTT